MTVNEEGMDGKVAVVTGSSKGIGLAVAEQLGAMGAQVIINARSVDGIHLSEQALRSKGYEVTGIPLDVTTSDGPSRLIDGVLETYGIPDYVVNLVAISPYYGPLLDADAKRFARTMTVNTWTAVAVVQAAIRHGMGEGGAVVNVSTIGARQYQPDLAAYCASKAGLEVITAHLANELGPRGIRVNTIAPGLVQTDMARVLWEGEYGRFEQSVLPLRRLGCPEDIAAAIVFLLSDQASWITGAYLAADGGRLITSLIHSPAQHLA